jgi:hypothetical protein
MKEIKFHAKRSSRNKGCVICCELMPEKSVKCIKCGSFQDWRRFLDYFPSMLPWATAITVSAVSAIGFIYNVANYPNSEFYHSQQRLDGDRIEHAELRVLISNFGSRPGEFGQITFECSSLGQMLCFSLYFTPNARDRTLNPGTSEVITFYSAYISDQEADMIANNYYVNSGIIQEIHRSMTCGLTLKVINFDGRDQDVTRSWPCREYIELMYHLALKIYRLRLRIERNEP